MEVISIYPDRILKKELEKIAKKEQRSLSSLAIIILSKYVRDRK